MMIIPAVFVFLGRDGMASGPSLSFSDRGQPFPVKVIAKNVPWHIRASRAVACDMFLLRASAHPRGAFFVS